MVILCFEPFLQEQFSNSSLGDGRNIKRVLLHWNERPSAQEVVKQLSEFENTHSGAIGALTVPQLKGILQVSCS